MVIVTVHRLGIGRTLRNPGWPKKTEESGETCH
jgi:hypothetical protein